MSNASPSNWGAVEESTDCILHESFGKAAQEGADHNLPIQAPGFVVLF
jgi:hypothetical protein